MNKFEKKSFYTSFLLFFFIQLILILFINYKERKIQLHYLHSNMKREFEICSYKLNCPNVKISFINKKATSLPIFELIKSRKEVFMFFDIPYIKNNYLKLSIPVSEYEKKVSKIDRKILDNISTDLIFILISSILFAFYVLKPLKKAYEINETFIKDILHDFNTPISSIQVNLYALKRNPNPKYIKRIENSINAIIKLQENLKSFLNTSPGNKEKFDLYEIIEEELEIYKNLYPYINPYNFAKKTYLCTNKQAFRSIISNILSNAFKYNKKNGYVKIYLKNDNLIIEDSGIGVKNPEKIFDRFYKENQRGIGIGMNIVKKLCDELNINIKLTSKPDIGTTVILNLSKIKADL